MNDDDHGRDIDSVDDPEHVLDSVDDHGRGFDPERVLERVDDGLAAALASALEHDPESVRAFLRAEGHLEDGPGAPGPPLTEPEGHLLDVVRAEGTPKSSAELRDAVAADHAEKLAAFASFRHRPWISAKVNSLARKGYVGKFRDGREVKVTPDPAEAVRRWALGDDRFGSELTPADVDDVVADTGMRPATVGRAIRRLDEG